MPHRKCVLVGALVGAETGAVVDFNMGNDGLAGIVSPTMDNKHGATTTRRTVTLRNVF